MVIQLSQKDLPEFQQHAGLFPLLQPTPARTGAPVWPRELAPLGTGPENPQDALNTAPILDARASTSRGNLRWRQLAAHHLPLLLGQTSPRHASPSRFPCRFMA